MLSCGVARCTIVFLFAAWMRVRARTGSTQYVCCRVSMSVLRRQTERQTFISQLQVQPHRPPPSPTPTDRHTAHRGRHQASSYASWYVWPSSAIGEGALDGVDESAVTAASASSSATRSTTDAPPATARLHALNRSS